MWNFLLLSVVVTMISLLFRHNLNAPQSVVDHPETSYDYVVVGAGTAGCVMASRLSENPNVTVLLVETGGYFNWLSSIPLIAPGLQKSQVDWSFRSETQDSSSRGLWDYQQIIPRGKGLGGSGQLNYLVHSFGSPEDYDHWPRGWSYAELNPYFLRVAETMRVRDADENLELARAMDVARQAMNGTDVKFSRAQTTLFEGTRWSTFQSHLQRAWNRKSLHVLVNTLVTRVLLNALNRSDGVEIQYDDGIKEKIEARREVILCAGAIGTPHLLLLSGIGSANELEKHKIPVKMDIPAVGKNYFDHLNMPVAVNLDAPVSVTLNKLQTFATLADYFVFGTGNLAHNGIMGIGRLNNSGVVLAGVAPNEKLLKELANYRTETFRSLYPTFNDTSREGFLFMSSCLQPKSRGFVALRSAELTDRPIIDPAYLERDEDVTCTIKGRTNFTDLPPDGSFDSVTLILGKSQAVNTAAIRLGLSILETPLFREFGAEVHVPDLEECQHLRQDYHDDAFAECAIRTSALTGHHPGGTCRMGESWDNETVVDEFLRVHRIEGLRIVDASVFPTPISGHPNSVIIALAEKAADVVSNSIRSRR